MASTREFIEELDTQIRELGAESERVGSLIGSNSSTIAARRKERDDLIRGMAEQLLPDLKPATFASLLARLRPFVSAQEAADMVAAESQKIQRQLERVTAQFDPAKYEAQKVSLGAKAEEEAGNLALVKPALDRFLETEGFTDLLRRGYGTQGYRFSRLTRRYYADWKLSDEILEQLKYANWQSLLTAYENAKRDVDDVKDAQRRAEESLRTLESLKARYDELTGELDAVPARVLEQLQTKLVAMLAGLDPMPPWMSRADTLNGQIADLEKQNTTLGESRARMTTDLSSMRSLRSKASASRRREIPDDYVNKLRDNRSRRSSGGFGPSYGSSTVIVYDDSSSYLNGLIIGEMFGRLEADRSGYSGGGGWGGGQRSGGYGSGRSYSAPDTSMQS